MYRTNYDPRESILSSKWLWLLGLGPAGRTPIWDILGEEPPNPKSAHDYNGQPECTDEREQEEVQSIFCGVLH